MNFRRLRMEFKVMSFNVRYDNSGDPYLWPQRLVGISEILSTHQPDVIGFQEVKARMYDDLKSELGADYDSYGLLRSEDDGAEMSAIFVRKERLNLTKPTSFWLSDTPEEPFSTGWDAALPRITSRVTIADKNTGEDLFAFMNTHFDHEGGEARKNSAKLIQGEMKRLQEQGLPVILTGDFNTYPADDPYTILTSTEGVTDSFGNLSKEEQKNALTFHDFEGGIQGEPIDYVFVTKHFTIKEIEIISGMFAEVYPSDHYPVLVELRLD